MLEYVHGERYLFKREEQPSVGIRALGQAFVSKRRTVKCWNTFRGKGICFIEKNSRVLEYVHGARHLFQREEQPNVGLRAWGKAFFQREEQPSVRIRAGDKEFVSKRRTAECWNTCMGQVICFKEKKSRVLEYVHEARHLFQREEQPSVGIPEGGKAFVSKRRTAECWNSCMGQGICFIEKNSRVLEHVQVARHLFQSEEQPSVGIRAWGKAIVSK